MGSRGGSYRTIHALPHDSGDERTECHHLIPAECLQAVGLDPSRGPVIQMVDREHRQTGSWGQYRRGKALRARILDMLQRGDYDAALEAGIEDVRAIAGNQYDGAIAEARRYYSTWRPRTSAGTLAASPGGAPTADAQANVTLLVNRLTHYVEVLDRHTVGIQHAYDQACESLANLQRVWGGEAAREFYSRFGSTTDALERYLDGARRMREILEERLNSLRQADRPG